MGMTIDESVSLAMTAMAMMLSPVDNEPVSDLYKALGILVDTARKYQMYQLDYEARLKADMVAMLEDLDLQIDESATYNLKVAKVQRLIRYKIDKLKREDLPHCQHTDEKIAKSFIEDVEAVKDQLPTTKNDLGVDCIVDILGSYTDLDIPYKREIAENILTKLSSVAPQESRKGHWINKQRLSINSCSAECSSCHKRSNGYVYDNGFSLVCTYYDFCPNCGSDNREVEE